ncbi:MAG: hypothetical protein HQM15_01580 [Deltaproteobacteria bacterium]|nr:hypothetical protein [Deltaproteobacteria bacterium]
MGILIKKYIWIAYLFLTALSAFFVAKIVNTYLGDHLIVERKFSFTAVSAPAQSSKVLPGFEAYKVILDRNLFDSKDAPLPATMPAEGTVLQQVNLDGPATRTSLNVKLLSTFSVGSGTDKRSTATVQADRGGTDVYTVEDDKQFAPGVKITKILSDRIEFVNSNRLEFVELENVSSKGGMPKASAGNVGNIPSTPGAKGSVAQQTPNKFTVDKAAVEDAVNNPDKLMTEIRVAPNLVNNKSQGLKVLSVNAGSLFSKLGLQRNDVLNRANGVEMNITNLPQLLTMLKSEKSISIDLERNAVKQSFEYEIR